MNATSFGPIRNGSLPHEFGDDKMEQIRQLLFGEFERRTEEKIALLESRIRELELGFHQRLDALEVRQAELSSQLTGGQRAAFDELSRGIDELGERLRKLPRD